MTETKEKTVKKAPSKAPQKQGWKTVFKIIALLVWVFSVVFVSQLIIGYIMLWILGRETFSQPVPVAIYSALSYILAFVCILFVTPSFKLIRKKNKKQTFEVMGKDDLGLKNWPTWTDIGLAPVGFIASLILAAILVWIFNLFPWFDAEQVQEVGFNHYIIGLDRIVAFITLVIVAPIAEELIFRGWLYGKLRLILSDKVSEKVSVAISIFLVSLLFGIIHMQWNVGVNVFALSVILCGLREITGTIHAGILVHMLKNGVAFYLLYILGL